MKMFHLPSTLLLGFVLSTLALARAQAFEPNMVKLHGKNTGIPNGYRFGASLAMNHKWIVVGEPNNSEGASNAGAVHVFDAKTFKHVVRLRGDLDAGASFGDAVAVEGDMVLVGAPFEETSLGMVTGAAYLFQLPSGRRVEKIAPTDSWDGDQFGCAVALDDGRAIAGACLADMVGTNSGAVYMFNFDGGYLYSKDIGDNSVAGDMFGKHLAAEGGLALISGGAFTATPSCYLFDIRSGSQLLRMDLPSANTISSVAIQGRRALIGMSTANDGATGGGAVALFDCDTGNLVERFWPENITDNDSFGVSVALYGNLACIGAQGRDSTNPESGSVFVYDLRNFSVIAELFPGDIKNGALFGNTVAMHGQRAISGAYYDNEIGTQAGSACVIEGLASPSPFKRIATVKDSAADIIDARHSSISSLYINAEDEGHLWKPHFCEWKLG